MQALGVDVLQTHKAAHYGPAGANAPPGGFCQGLELRGFDALHALDTWAVARGDLAADQDVQGLPAGKLSCLSENRHLVVLRCHSFGRLCSAGLRAPCICKCVGRQGLSREKLLAAAAAQSCSLAALSFSGLTAQLHTRVQRAPVLCRCECLGG